MAAPDLKEGVVERTDPDIEHMLPFIYNNEDIGRTVILIIIGLFVLIFSGGVWYGCS